MGARLFNPDTGLFLSADAVLGGNPSAYGYPPDPINFSDISGLEGTVSQAPNGTYWCTGTCSSAWHTFHSITRTYVFDHLSGGDLESYFGRLTGVALQIEAGLYCNVICSVESYKVRQRRYINVQVSWHSAGNGRYKGYFRIKIYNVYRAYMNLRFYINGETEVGFLAIARTLPDYTYYGTHNPSGGYSP